MINSVALESLAEFRPSCFPSFNRSKKLSNGQANACHSLDMEIRNIPLFEPERKKNKDSTCIMQMKLTQHRRNWKQVQQGSLLTTQHSIKQALNLISKTAVNPNRNYRSIVDRRTFRPSQLFALHIGSSNSTTMHLKDDIPEMLINKDMEILTVTKLASPVKRTNKKPKFFQTSPNKTKTSYKPISHIGNLKQLKEQKEQRQQREQRELREFSRSATVYTSQQREKKQQKDELEIRFYEPESNIEVERMEDARFLLEQCLNANSFVVVRSFNNNHAVLGHCRSQEKVEIASLTKIMTCLLVLLVTEKLQISLRKTTIKVGLKASLMQGTSANLQFSDVISIYDLLHGLMLPSGNDAALALADWTGKAIRRYCNASISPRKISFTRLNQCMRTPIGLFVYHMNCLARSLEMNNTKFANCHGLANKKNVSCAYDLSKLCIFAMKREDFSKIVKVQQYTCQVNNTKFLNQRMLTWKNTNKLLRLQMAYGIKTGMTPSAGPCLASCFRISDSESIFIVLLNTLTAVHRFEESKKLLVQTMRNLHEVTGDRLYLLKLQEILGNKLEIKPQELAQDFNSMDIQEDEETEEDQTAQYSESVQN